MAIKAQWNGWRDTMLPGAWENAPPPELSAGKRPGRLQSGEDIDNACNLEQDENQQHDRHGTEAAAGG